MCGRHSRHRRHFHRGRVPSREELVRDLEERQKDLEQEIADIHDLLRRLREAGDTQSPAEPVASI